MARLLLTGFFLFLFCSVVLSDTVVNKGSSDGQGELYGLIMKIARNPEYSRIVKWYQCLEMGDFGKLLDDQGKYYLTPLIPNNAAVAAAESYLKGLKGDDYLMALVYQLLDGRYPGKWLADADVGQQIATGIGTYIYKKSDSPLALGAEGRTKKNQFAVINKKNLYVGKWVAHGTSNMASVPKGYKINDEALHQQVKNHGSKNTCVYKML